ncbi:MAG: restriction endonuclease subunit S [Candidatus Competibacteraceae bacterium]|nr:restriction endonuclease subunit S [Candidatus Competibacteraceae bacterium]
MSNQGRYSWNSTNTGTAGRVAIYPVVKNPLVADSHVTIIRLANFISQYVWCYLASPIIQARMTPNQEGSMVSGTTNQVELSTSKVAELPVPCPPIEEQKRIVAKVDELMALCDKLGSTAGTGTAFPRAFPRLSCSLCGIAQLGEPQGYL